MPLPSLPIMQGTLDLLVLRTLNARPMHGYGIATLVNQRTAGELAIERRRLVPGVAPARPSGTGGGRVGAPSENNRRARYYTITAAG